MTCYFSSCSVHLTYISYVQNVIPRYSGCRLSRSGTSRTYTSSITLSKTSLLVALVVSVLDSVILFVGVIEWMGDARVDVFQPANGAHRVPAGAHVKRRPWQRNTAYGLPRTGRRCPARCSAASKRGLPRPPWRPCCSGWGSHQSDEGARGDATGSVFRLKDMVLCIAYPFEGCRRQHYAAKNRHHQSNKGDGEDTMGPVCRLTNHGAMRRLSIRVGPHSSIPLLRTPSLAA